METNLQEILQADVKKIIRQRAIGGFYLIPIVWSYVLWSRLKDNPDPASLKFLMIIAIGLSVLSLILVITNFLNYPTPKQWYRRINKQIYALPSRQKKNFAPVEAGAVLPADLFRSDFKGALDDTVGLYTQIKSGNRELNNSLTVELYFRQLDNDSATANPIHESPSITSPNVVMAPNSQAIATSSVYPVATKGVLATAAPVSDDLTVHEFLDEPDGTMTPLKTALGLAFIGLLIAPTILLTGLAAMGFVMPILLMIMLLAWLIVPVAVFVSLYAVNTLIKMTQVYQSWMYTCVSVSVVALVVSVLYHYGKLFSVASFIGLSVTGSVSLLATYYIQSKTGYLQRKYTYSFGAICIAICAFLYITR
jgi:hypothetical protein